MHKKLIPILLLLCLLCASTARAEVVFNPNLHAFPTKLADGTYSPDGPRPFTVGEMGDGLLEIWFGRVGVCDCFIVRCNGEVMMIDGGTVRHNKATRLLLGNLGITRVDYLFNTHHHDDHLQEQEYLVRSGFEAGIFLTPYRRDFPVEGQLKMQNTVDKAGIPYKTLAHGDKMMLGGENGAEITFYRWTKNTQANFSSMMCRMVYGERSIYFMADVIGVAQKDLAENYLDEILWDSDILKVGHHGYTAQEPALLNAISPELCIITNTQAEAEMTVKQLKQLDIPFRATTAGTIYVRTDGSDGWEYVQDKSYLEQ